MTLKEQALWSLMEANGYSYGLMTTAIRILGQSREALDDMIVFIQDEHPSEEQVISYIAGMCE